VKTHAKQEQLIEAMREAAEAIAEDLPRVDPAPEPEARNADLLTVITITDLHIGMMAWHEEGGEDWDLKVAEQVVCAVVKDLIDRAEGADTCVIAQLGDLLHYDGLLPVTHHRPPFIPEHLSPPL